MTIHKVCKVEVRVSRSEEVTLLFTPLHGGEPERDTDGSFLQFGIPLGRDAVGLAALVYDFARWITGLAVQELQAQQDAVHRATAPPTSADLPSRVRKGE